MKVIFTCGGTAGHVNPALALAQYMQERIENLDILFVGTPDGMERGLVEQAGYAFRGVEVGGFCRSLAPSGIRHNLKSVEHLLAAKGRVRAILRDFPPTSSSARAATRAIPSRNTPRSTASPRPYTSRTWCRG